MRGTALAPRTIELLGVPLELGAGTRGLVMGPAALRTAGLTATLEGLGHTVRDRGDLVGAPCGVSASKLNPRLKNFPEVAGWTRKIIAASEDMARGDVVSVFFGGDHSIALGTVPGVARAAKAVDRELFVLWLDAHPDFNTFDTTESGNLHGVPAAFFCGLPGFDALLGAPFDAPVNAANVCMMGIRSVDPDEGRLLVEHGVLVHDMRAIDEHGVAALLRPFLETVKQRNGLLHVSLDVDFLDPEIAPGVGTTVPGGATFREAHLICELLHDSGLVSSLDVVELNPFLDDRGRTARLMVDLVASLFGKRVMDRPTRSRWSH